MKYSIADIQRIMDDLDFAQSLVLTVDAEGNQLTDEVSSVRNSLKHASQILNDLPDEVFEALDMKFL